MTVLKQIFEISLMNLRNLPSRLGSSSVIVVGIAGVVSVLVGLLSMASGFNAVLQNTSSPDRAVVVRDGSISEVNSVISIQDLNIVSRMEGISGSSGELFVIADVPKKSTGTPANLVIRGVQQSAFGIRPELHIVEGRNFQTGVSELITGAKASVAFSGLEIGEKLQFRDSTWTVVGMFESGGNAYESEVWADLPVVQTAFRRDGSINTIRVILDDPSLATEIHQRIQDDPRLDLKLVTEDEFYQAQSKERTDMINTFGVAVGVIMAIGAVFAALNTMYSAVSVRTVEIATLRALGFGGLPVVVSVMIEALTLASIGGLLGGGLVYLIFDGYTASTLNTTGSFSQVVFDFAVTPELLQLGITWALLLGLVGGLFPAVHAARLPITKALRGE
ncbi:MAG: ABC transporter permease [Gammaproteobacteria bacterium]|nr:ABC transporter permease [Gammaproteobacteria bacterium]